MAGRYLLWYEWEGVVEEGKAGQRKGRVPRSRGMSEEGVEEGSRAEQSRVEQEGKINMEGAEDVTVSARLSKRPWTLIGVASKQASMPWGLSLSLVLVLRVSGSLDQFKS